MEHAVAFAETGYLCRHANANSANQVLDRIINFFSGRTVIPADGLVTNPKPWCLSESVPKQDGSRAAVVEIMLTISIDFDPIFKGEATEIKSFRSWRRAGNLGMQTLTRPA
jgi:Tfp pilus assembly ATPase PilU